MGLQAESIIKEQRGPTLQCIYDFVGHGIRKLNAQDAGVCLQ